MRFLSFNADGRDSYGIATDDGVFDLGVRLGSVVPDLRTLLRARFLQMGDIPKPTSTDFAHGQFTYLPVIANPGKILCVGLNYATHIKETGRPDAAHPSIFTRFADTLLGHERPIIRPTISSSLDFEGELAVVIGQPGFRVPEQHALSLVAGYACFNDVTVRDWQHHTHQFTPGKNFPATGPFGPVLVTPDEVGRLDDQPIKTELNASTVQSAVLGDMVFSIPRIISYVSSFTRLSPGDIIATGTPGGVGAKRTPPLFMQPGDVVRVSIGGVGELSNAVVAETEDSATRCDGI